MSDTFDQESYKEGLDAGIDVALTLTNGVLGTTFADFGQVLAHLDLTRIRQQTLIRQQLEAGTLEPTLQDWMTLFPVLNLRTEANA